MTIRTSMLCVFLEEILSLLLPVSTDRRMLTTSVLMEDIGLALLLFDPSSLILERVASLGM